MNTTPPGTGSPLLTGLSAFPLTPINNDASGTIDENAFSNLIARAAAASVDSITVLGSTGSYAYLHSDERRRVELAIEAAGDVPVLVGVGATRTSDVLRLAEHAQDAGAAGLLVAVRCPELSDQLNPLWGLFSEHGSYRVTSTLAEELGLVAHPNLPRPVLGLDNTGRNQVRAALRALREGGVPGLDTE